MEPAVSQAPIMARPFDGISQQLDFASGGEDGSSSSSSDNSLDGFGFRIRSPRLASPGVLSPGSACRTPRVRRHRARSGAASSPSQCTSPIPYATWRKLRLCDSPSTPKVRRTSPRKTQAPNQTSQAQWWVYFLGCLHPCRACCPSPPSPAPAPRSATARGPYASSPPLPASSAFLRPST